MPRTKWTDERLDDLAKIVLDNDARLDVTAAMATHSADDLEDLHKRDAMRSRSRYEQAAIVAAILSPIATLIIALLERHP